MSNVQSTYRAVRAMLLVLIIGLLCYIVAFSSPIDQLTWSLRPKPTLVNLTNTINRQQAALVRNELLAGSLARQAGALDQAAGFYRAAIAIAPSSTSYVELVTILIDQQSIPQATAVLQDALLRFPNNLSLLQLQADLQDAQ